MTRGRTVSASIAVSPQRLEVAPEERGERRDLAAEAPAQLGHQLLLGRLGRREDDLAAQLAAQGPHDAAPDPGRYRGVDRALHGARDGPLGVVDGAFEP